MDHYTPGQLDALFEAHLLCAVCEEARATTIAQHCAAKVCADCASNEPAPDQDER